RRAGVDQGGRAAVRADLHRLRGPGPGLRDARDDRWPGPGCAPVRYGLQRRIVLLVVHTYLAGAPFSSGGEWAPRSSLSSSHSPPEIRSLSCPPLQFACAVKTVEK